MLMTVEYRNRYHFYAKDYCNFMKEERDLTTVPLYKFHDFYRSRKGSYVIVAKEDGNSRGFFKLSRVSF